jgi:hypothetical protein
MGFGIGRARALAAFALGAAAVLAGSTRAAAQDSEEVILDPELVGSDAPGPAANSSATDTSAQTSGEDYGWGEVYPNPTPNPPPAPASMSGLPSVKEAHESAVEDDPLANTALARLEMLGQVGVDLHQEGDLEDVYETRLRFGGEIEYRRSRTLRLVIGSRLDFFWAVPGRNDNIIKESLHDRALDEDRFETDIFATAAYIDKTLADGLHLRVGQQSVSMARMDFYSPMDMLAVYDLRPQPRVDLANNKLAQPAIRMDWDINSWATIQAVYVPWFMPDLSRPNRDQYVARVLGGGNTSQLPANLRSLIDPSWQTKMSESYLRFVGPPPDFKTPQAQVRATFRGDSMEFGLSAGTALEKLPAIYMAPSVSSYAINPNDKNALTTIGGAVVGQQSVVDVEYHRYSQFALDGSFDLSPVQIGFEFAFSPSRHLYAATSDGKHLPVPNVSQQITDPVQGPNNTWTASNVTDHSIRKGVPMIQGAVHVEWLKGESFALVGEAFWMNALGLPYDKSRDWWGFIPKTGAYAGGFLSASYTLAEGRLRFDATTVVLVGPSFILIPHMEVKAREGLYLDCGVQMIEGPDPGLNGMQKVNIGGLLSGYDNAFVGIRWLP